MIIAVAVGSAFTAADAVDTHAGNQLGYTTQNGFAGFTVGGAAGTTVDCGTGVFDGTTATTFPCDVTARSQDVATIQATDISVSN